MQRILCLLIGYACGNFLTAEVVCRLRAGRSARTMGSGNPGMANVMEQLGKAPGLLVLAGDVGKTALACFVCRLILFPGLGVLAVLYAGLGTALGHNFPLWLRFKGGKGVAVTCAFLVFALPLWGLCANLAGAAVVLLTGYLPVGAVVIPCAFVLPALLCRGPEAGALAALAAALMLSRHLDGLDRIRRGQEKKFRLSKNQP